MDAGRRKCSEGRVLCALLLVVLQAIGGCASWQLPRIDPTGERIFIWPHEQPPGGVIGPPLASTGPTSSPFPPAGVLGAPSEAAPSTLPPQTALSEDGAPPPSTFQGPPLWPDPNAPALFPNGVSGLGCPGSCPLAPGAAAVAPLAASVGPVDRVQVTPPTIVAPVGSEVVVRGGICSGDGFLITGRPLEWLLDSSGVGQIVSVGQAKFLQAHHALRKFDNHYALGRTSSHQTILDCGTPQTGDDVVVQKGEAWVSISSSVEGTSRITALAKEVKTWHSRRATATVHWVDAQWVLPQSAVNPVGQSHVLTTNVSRLTDSRPLAGYVVRYELLDADLAGFAPDGAQVAEVVTNDAGQASIELFPAERRAGSVRVNVQVIRPEITGPSGSPRLALASSTITKTWTAPDLVISTNGPSEATVGAGVTYRIVVTNQGQSPATEVNVAARWPAGLAFVGSNPAPPQAAGPLSWTFDSIEANGTGTILLDLRAEAAGLAEVCAEVRSAEGLAAEDCAATDVIATAPMLDIQIDGPATANVGDVVSYTVTITNRGNAPATDLVVTDTFDVGLSHARAPEGVRTIENRDFGDLAPGESRPVYLDFTVDAAGRLCHEVVVESEGGDLRAVESACVEATEAQQPVGPALTVDSIAPPQAEQGEIQRFAIVIENTGDVPLTDLRIQQEFEDAFEPRFATEGHFRVGNALTWTVESLAPGQRTVYEIEYEMMRPTAAGRPARTRTTVTAGELQQSDESAVEILPRQSPAPTPGGAPPPPAEPEMTLELQGGTNPVPAGVRTTYQVFLTNTGQLPATDVTLQVGFTAELSPVLQLINRALENRNIRAVMENGTLRFTPIRELLPGERVSFSLPFDATQQGTARLTVSVTSPDLDQPLVMPEQTATVLPRQ